MRKIHSLCAASRKTYIMKRIEKKKNGDLRKSSSDSGFPADNERKNVSKSCCLFPCFFMQPQNHARSARSPTESMENIEKHPYAKNFPMSLRDCLKNTTLRSCFACGGTHTACGGAQTCFACGGTADPQKFPRRSFSKIRP